MVITEKKPIEEIKESLSGYKNILVLGCSECAEMCQTGGEDEVREMAETLGEGVLESGVLTTACNVLLTKRELKDYLKDKDFDAILSLACGNGVQVISEITGLPVLPGNNTVFVGERIRNGVFEENCRTCGECVLGRTAAICPVSRCSKSLLNGPCGGSTDGKCEVDSEQDCAWVLIFNRLKEMDRLDLFEEIYEPRSSMNSSHPRKLNLRRH